MTSMERIAEQLAHRLYDPHDPLLRVELRQTVELAMSAGYLALLGSDTDYPDFWPIFNPVYTFLAPNPDVSYCITQIDARGIYRICGTRGTVRVLDFQFGSGQLMTTGRSDLGATVASYDPDKDLRLAANGAFEVVLSQQRPDGYEGDWWRMDPRTDYMMVRQISYDPWHEIDGRFAIERLDRPAIRPRPSAAELESRLRQIPVYAEKAIAFSLQQIAERRARGLINKVVVHDMLSLGGVPRQRYVDGLFEIQPDEALIYETSLPAQCRYWGIQLTDELWRAIEPLHRQSSLNGHTARIDQDGKFRAVIASQDPGVPNWLDTGGYTRGTLFGRWTDGDSAPEPQLRKVKLAHVRRYLPPDTPVICAEERDAAIRLRRTAAQLRRRW